MDNPKTTFSCDCGEVKVLLSPSAIQTSTRAICYCQSCRGAELHFRKENPNFTREGGVDILLTTPDRIEIEGADKLKIMRISEKGIFRWYAACCNSPMVNTLSKPNIAFAAVIVPRDKIFPSGHELGQPLHVRTKSHPQGQDLPYKDQIMRETFRVLRLMIAGFFRHEQNPFLKNGTKTPIANPELLSDKARTELYTLAH